MVRPTKIQTAKEVSVPFSPSEGQKTNALDEVFYEIEQLVSLATHRNFDRNLNNAVVESNLLHLRNLRDFFNHLDYREKDEVLASDYGFPHSPIDIHRKYSERLNKDLAHITYSRVSRSEADKAWPYDLVIFRFSAD